MTIPADMRKRLGLAVGKELVLEACDNVGRPLAAGAARRAPPHYAVRCLWRWPRGAAVADEQSGQEQGAYEGLDEGEEGSEDDEQEGERAGAAAGGLARRGAVAVAHGARGVTDPGVAAAAPAAPATTSREAPSPRSADGGAAARSAGSKGEAAAKDGAPPRPRAPPPAPVAPARPKPSVSPPPLARDAATGQQQQQQQQRKPPQEPQPLQQPGLGTAAAAGAAGAAACVHDPDGWVPAGADPASFTPPAAADAQWEQVAGTITLEQMRWRRLLPGASEAAGAGGGAPQAAAREVPAEDADDGSLRLCGVVFAVRRDGGAAAAAAFARAGRADWLRRHAGNEQTPAVEIVPLPGGGSRKGDKGQGQQAALPASAQPRPWHALFRGGEGGGSSSGTRTGVLQRRLASLLNLKVRSSVLSSLEHRTRPERDPKQARTMCPYGRLIDI